MHIYITIFLYLFLYSFLAVAEENEEIITLPDIEIQSSIGDRTKLTPGTTNYIGRDNQGPFWKSKKPMFTPSTDFSTIPLIF